MYWANQMVRPTVVKSHEWWDTSRRMKEASERIRAIYEVNNDYKASGSLWAEQKAWRQRKWQSNNIRKGRSSTFSIIALKQSKIGQKSALTCRWAIFVRDPPTPGWRTAFAELPWLWDAAPSQTSGSHGSLAQHQLATLDSAWMGRRYAGSVKIEGACSVLHPEQSTFMSTRSTNCPPHYV